MHIPETEKNAT